MIGQDAQPDIQRGAWDADTVESAYRVWSTDGRQSTGVTAELVNVPVSTVRRWVKQHGWRDRLEAEAHEAIGPARSRAALMLTDRLTALTAQLLRISENAELDRDKLAAIRLAFEVLGIIGSKANTAQGTTNNTLIVGVPDAKLLEKVRGMTDKQLTQAAGALLGSNNQ